jgi:hypothetical protein
LNGGDPDRAFLGEPGVVAGYYRLDDFDATYCSAYCWSGDSELARRRGRASREGIETKRNTTGVKVLQGTLHVDLTVPMWERSPNASISAGHDQVNRECTLWEKLCAAER